MSGPFQRHGAVSKHAGAGCPIDTCTRYDGSGPGGCGDFDTEPDSADDRSDAAIVAVQLVVPGAGFQPALLL